MSSATTPATGSVPPSNTAASPSDHLLIKPISGGMPVMARLPSTNTPEVRPMLRPSPRKSRTSSARALTTYTPAARNSVIFISEWNTRCISPAAYPCGVSSSAPNRM